mmetsp:Transcript_26650/g.38077  ORF Transcript_26650/g.38077 Transcript_26650/m.38077 type:complete len:297 (+) Transcript_26650:1440-2330(+)
MRTWEYPSLSNQLICNGETKVNQYNGCTSCDEESPRKIEILPILVLQPLEYSSSIILSRITVKTNHYKYGRCNEGCQRQCRQRRSNSRSHPRKRCRHPNGKQYEEPHFTKIENILFFRPLCAKECAKEAQKEHGHTNKDWPDPKNESIGTIIVNTRARLITPLRKLQDTILNRKTRLLLRGIHPPQSTVGILLKIRHTRRSFRQFHPNQQIPLIFWITKHPYHPRRSRTQTSQEQWPTQPTHICPGIHLCIKDQLDRQQPQGLKNGKQAYHPIRKLIRNTQSKQHHTQNNDHGRQI